MVVGKQKACVITAFLIILFVLFWLVAVRLVRQHVCGGSLSDQPIKDDRSLSDRPPVQYRLTWLNARRYRLYCYEDQYRDRSVKHLIAKSQLANCCLR